MSSPTGGFTVPDTTPQDNSAEYPTIAVRADHWAAIQSFIDAQRSVVKANDPQDWDAKGPEAFKKLEEIQFIIDKYNTAQDTVKLTVDSGDGQLQNAMVSRDAPSFEIGAGTVSSTDNTTKLEKQSQLKSDKGSKTTTNNIPPGKVTHQSRTAAGKDEVKPAHRTTAETTSGSSNTNSDAIRSARKANAPNPIAYQPSATSPHVSEGTFQGVASESKQNLTRLASPSKSTSLSTNVPHTSTSVASLKEVAPVKSKAIFAASKTALTPGRDSTGTPVLGSDQFKNLLKDIKAPVVQSKAPSPVEVARAQDQKLAVQKQPNRVNALELTKSKNLQAAGAAFVPSTFKFTANGNRVEKGAFVRPNAPPKTEKSAPARKSYSSALTQGATITSSSAGDVVQTALSIKTNKRKSVPMPELVAGDSTPLKPVKPVIKRKTVTTDGKVIAVDGKPVLNYKRQRVTVESRAGDLVNKPATKQASGDDLVGTLSPSSVVEALPTATPDATVESKISHEVVHHASRETEGLPAIVTNATGDTNRKPGSPKIAGSFPNLPSERSGALEPQKGIIGVQVTKTNSHSHQKDHKVTKATEHRDQDLTIFSITKQLKDATHSLHREAGVKKTSRLTKQDGKKMTKTKSGLLRARYDDDLSLIKENWDQGHVLSAPRRRLKVEAQPQASPALVSSTPSSSPSLSPPLPTSTASTSTVQSISPSPSDASDTSDAAPSCVTHSPTSPKRKRSSSDEDDQTIKRNKVTGRIRRHVPTTTRSLSEAREIEADARRMIEKHCGPQADWTELYGHHMEKR